MSHLEDETETNGMPVMAGKIVIHLQCPACGSKNKRVRKIIQYPSRGFRKFYESCQNEWHFDEKKVSDV